MEKEKETNGWGEYKRMLLSDREANQKNFKELFQKIDIIHVEIAKLKVKSGIWGIIGGMLPILATIIIYIIFKGVK